MKFIILITALLSLTSCFKTDTSGNAFIFESENHAVLKFNFTNINAASNLYFGQNGEYSTNDADINGFTSAKRWCLGLVNLQIDSGSEGGSAYWEANINGSNTGAPTNAGSHMSVDIYPGDNLKIYMYCGSCASATGSFTIELNDCSNN